MIAKLFAAAFGFFRRRERGRGGGPKPPAERMLEMEQKIEESRRKFARTLVGCWSTAQGSFKAVMDQVWEIRPDGTGRYIDTGPFGYPRYEARFQWRQSEPFVFEFRITEEIYHQPNTGGAEADDMETDDEPRPWISIRYDFKAVPTDVGTEIGLVDSANILMDHGSFYFSLAPLAYDGPLDT